MNDRTATIIKVGAVVTAAPRWIVALLLAEGLTLPPAWLGWWTVLSAILSAGMAITEALAFAYIFEAWRNQRDGKSNYLLVMAGVAAVIFVAIVGPYVVANVRMSTLETVLGPVGVWLWGIAVAASTIVIVAAVGFAQKLPAQPRKVSEKLPEVAVTLPEKQLTDWRTLPEEDRLLIGEMTTPEICRKYGVSDRTARNWKAATKRNGHHATIG